MSLTKEKIELLKQWGAILMVLLSLITSITAHFKEEKEKTAKAAYTELATEMKKASEIQVQTQKDLAKLQGQMDGMIAVQVMMAQQQKNQEEKIEKPKSVNRRLTPLVRRQPTKADEIVIAANSIPSAELEAKPTVYEPPPIEVLVK